MEKFIYAGSEELWIYDLLKLKIWWCLAEKSHGRMLFWNGKFSEKLKIHGKIPGACLNEYFEVGFSDLEKFTVAGEKEPLSKEFLKCNNSLGLAVN